MWFFTLTFITTFPLSVFTAGLKSKCEKKNPALVTIQWWHGLHYYNGRKKKLTANNLDPYKKTICSLSVILWSKSALSRFINRETTEAGQWAVINIFHLIEICKPSGVAVSLIIKMRKNRAKNKKRTAPSGWRQHVGLTPPQKELTAFILAYSLVIARKNHTETYGCYLLRVLLQLFNTGCVKPTEQ